LLLTEDDVVGDFDFEKLTGSDQIPRHPDICCARSWVAAWMIVLCGVRIYVQLIEQRVASAHAGMSAGG